MENQVCLEKWGLGFGPFGKEREVGCRVPQGKQGKGKGPKLKVSNRGL